MIYTTKKINFEKILPIWRKLWPVGKIYPISSMLYLGGYDVSIQNKFTPSYFALCCDKEIIGVISGHKSNQEQYRLRGLYIESEYRNRFLSKKLFECIDKQARKENCNFIWSLPRKQAIKAYKSAGFVQSTKFFSTQDVSWYENCYVFKNIK